MLHESTGSSTHLLGERAQKLGRRIERWSAWRAKTFDLWRRWIQVRLVAGLGLVVGLLLTALPGGAAWWAAVTFFGLLPTFIVLVITTSRIKSKTLLAEKLVAHYERQLARLNGTYFDPRFALEKEDPDLQRTGEKSILSLMDESFSTEGREQLKSELYGFKSLPDTRATQNLLKSLQDHPWLHTRWLITGQSYREPMDLTRIDRLFEAFEMTKADRVHSYVSIAAFLFFLGTFGALGPENAAVWYVFIFQGLIHLAYLPRSYRLLHRALELSHHWHFVDLQTKALFKRDLWRKNFPKSFIFQGFSAKQSSRLKTVISLADINNHPLLSIFVHLMIPWLPSVCLILGGFLERWKKHWPQWRKEFIEIEKYSNLALFSHWHPVAYPAFTESIEVQTKELFHPLIDRANRVSNDLHFKPPLKTVLLSGSNMAGKSTFLRTLAINQILAVAGLPVFARSFTTFHGPVLSCIQISDSLRDGFSYFMSEVMRLKNVLDEASHDQRPCLVVIDEIFRGTNNRERHLGSQSVIKKLVASPSLSVVSTHDLELTRLADDNPKIENYHFREDYEGQTMIFHYKLYQGPSPTTNALKIMAQNGLYEETL